MPAPAKRPTDVANANALARHVGRILLGQPQRVHREVRAAYAEQEQAGEEPARSAVCRQIEDVAERRRTIVTNITTK